MIHVALFEPEIPPNTGNIIRLCANTGAQLHLIHPLGFKLDDKACRRAGLDYREYASIAEYDNIEDFFAQVDKSRVYACTTKGSTGYHQASYQEDDVLLFGPETRGLPASVLEQIAPSHKIRIPMREDSRSINLSNATAIILYEAWRQLDFPGMQ